VFNNQLRLAWVQHTATADIDANLAHISDALRELKYQQPDIVVLPEAFAWLAPDLRQMNAVVEDLEDGRLQAHCQRWAQELGCYLVAGSLPLRIEGQIYATLCVYNPQGELETYYCKNHLFSVVTPNGVTYRESAFFTAGAASVIWHSPWGKIGLAICFDLRFPAMFRNYAQQGVRLIILPAAFTQETGQAHWHTLVRARAIENQMMMLAVNQVGEHALGLQSYGHSLLVDAWGEVLVDSGDSLAIGSYEFDLSPVDLLRQQFPVLLQN
jgi:predicted amidohydrolase